MSVQSPAEPNSSICARNIGRGPWLSATPAIFTVSYAWLLKPLPYPNSDRLISMRYTAPGVGMTDVPQAPSNYLIAREQGKRVFEEVAMWDRDRVTVTGSGEPEQVEAL